LPLRKSVDPSNWNPPLLVEESQGVQQGQALFPSVPGLSISLVNGPAVHLEFLTGYRDRLT
jgi:hypothetical protein